MLRRFFFGRFLFGLFVVRSFPLGSFLVRSFPVEPFRGWVGSCFGCLVLSRFLFGRFVVRSFSLGSFPVELFPVEFCPFEPFPFCRSCTSSSVVSVEAFAAAASPTDSAAAS